MPSSRSQIYLDPVVALYDDSAHIADQTACPRDPAHICAIDKCHSRRLHAPRGQTQRIRNARRWRNGFFVARSPTKYGILPSNPLYIRIYLVMDHDIRQNASERGQNTVNRQCLTTQLARIFTVGRLHCAGSSRHSHALGTRTRRRDWSPRIGFLAPRPCPVTAKPGVWSPTGVTKNPDPGNTNSATQFSILRYADSRGPDRAVERY